MSSRIQNFIVVPLLLCWLGLGKPQRCSSATETLQVNVSDENINAAWASISEDCRYREGVFCWEYYYQLFFSGQATRTKKARGAAGWGRYLCKDGTSITRESWRAQLGRAVVKVICSWKAWCQLCFHWWKLLSVCFPGKSGEWGREKNQIIHAQWPVMSVETET